VCVLSWKNTNDIKDGTPVRCSQLIHGDELFLNAEWMDSRCVLDLL
jgi:hypothetical protein